ncbi:MAG: hypothetical protein R3B95_08800 [Nitrospirales bacterium]|nr:hypothetical protein [Nitrospirales bacterium]
MDERTTCVVVESGGGGYGWGGGEQRINSQWTGGRKGFPGGGFVVMAG